MFRTNVVLGSRLFHFFQGGPRTSRGGFLTDTAGMAKVKGKGSSSPTNLRSGPMGDAHRRPVAEPARRLRHLETAFKRYRDWVKADVFIKFFEACSDAPDMGDAMVDATFSRSIATARAQKGTHSQAIGRCKVP